jgi:hypothetical protein
VEMCNICMIIGVCGLCDRHKEDGVQDSPVAREVFLLLCVQNCHRHQELHPS